MPHKTNQSVLAGLIENSAIPFKKQFDHHETGYDKSVIFPIMNDFYQFFQDGLILYGGQTAIEKIYGYKKMRSATNDLDYVIKKTMLESLVKKYHLSYHTIYDVLFTYIEHIPITFTLDHIHDWEIDTQFYSTSRIIQFDQVTTCCCSPEYSILLKLMRSVCAWQKAGKIFGKDGIDIVNMMTAPTFRPDLKPIEYSSLFQLIADYLTKDFNLINTIFDQIYKYRQHLDEPGQMEFTKHYEKISQDLQLFFKIS
ncbi:MAG: hypothetical protein MJB14_13310 [Spirochaetes bacterium]|nr:hypothetical protein [Spirochaetota bacterium]